MNEKEKQHQPVDGTGGPKAGSGKAAPGQGQETARKKTAGKGGDTGNAKAGPATREDRLADALRANLRRRKSAAKAKDSA